MPVFSGLSARLGAILSGCAVPSFLEFLLQALRFLNLGINGESEGLSFLVR